ncbi:hypothetical protein COR50_00875 [Chitinophaga caeni]|uniref:PKD domain-containing protein n=2 Tax=Chitinophaga caeni TaxID=2029983 RepID=A0A291QPG4_9BACT|nr:hypothetical protein COR50_00875 [Chitinophaga caeni]
MPVKTSQMPCQARKMDGKMTKLKRFSARNQLFQRKNWYVEGLYRYKYQNVIAYWELKKNNVSFFYGWFRQAPTIYSQNDLTFLSTKIHDEMIRFISLISLFLAYVLPSGAQGLGVPAHDTLPAQIILQQEGNRVQLKPGLRPLRQVAGAPEAFYTYFWELGDGSFSFDKEPLHQYKDTGEFDIRLYATNNYDDGKPPKSKPRRIKVKKRTFLADASTGSHFFKSGGSIEMKINRMPRPGEDLVAIIGYRNKAENDLSNLEGSLLLFYNEKQFKQKNFELADARAYHGEKSTSVDSILTAMENTSAQNFYAVNGPSESRLIDPGYKEQFIQLLASKQAMYSAQQAWNIKNIAAGEEKFMFLTLNTLPGMIKDTNAVVTVSAVFVPTDLSLPLEQFDLEMQIVASHDPNKMQLKHRWMNYRFVRKNKELTYKVRFQNTGAGPAKLVKVGVKVPGMLSAASLELVDYSPRCVPCDSAYQNQSCIDTLIRKDSVYFVFKNIYLPGMQQDGVSDKDSTQGFVKYKVKFNKELKKLPFYSQAAIIFDKNEPVITNRSYGRFKPGLSLAAIAGFGNLRMKDSGQVNSNRQITLGAALSPFAPYRLYWQVEAYLNVHQKQTDFKGFVDGGRDTTIGTGKYVIISREIYEEQKILSADIVPIHLRYNVNKFLGLGAGAMMSLTLSDKLTPKNDILVAEPNNPVNSFTVTSRGTSVNKGLDYWGTAIFGDVNLGLVRQGPALGIRYIQYLDERQGRWFFYGTFRF